MRRPEHNSMRKRLAALTLVFTIVVILLGTIWPVQNVQAKERKKVRLGYMWGYHFQEGAADGEKKSGFAYDYLQQVAAYSGWDYEYVYGSWEDCYEMLLQGEIDLMAGVSYTEERTEYIQYADLPMSIESYHIFVNAEDAGEYPNLDALKGKTVGVSASTLVMDSIRTWEARNHYGIQIRAYADDDARMAAFERGETDATSDLGIQVGAESGLVPVAEFGIDNTYIAVAKDRTDLLNDLNAALATINTVTPGYTASLFQKYFKDTVVMSTLTSEDAAWFAAHPTIEVGYLESMAPFTVKGENDQPIGMYIDLIEDAFETLGLDNEILYRPYRDMGDMHEALQMGKLDMAVPLLLPTYAAEEMNILQSMEVASVRMNMISRDQQEMKEDLVIGIPDSETGIAGYVSQYYPNNPVIHYPNMGSLLKAVRSGKVDVTILNGYSVSMYIRNQKDLQINELPDSASLTVGISQADTELLRMMNRSIAAWGSDDVQKALLVHTDEAYSPSLAEFVRANAGMVLALAVALISILALLLLVIIFQHRQRKIADRNAHIDNMTELRNRRAYEEDVAEMSSKPLPENLIVSVMDINGLKSSNDNLGHSAGDEMITGLAWCIRETIHDPAFASLNIKAYRTGGDEFVIIVPASEEAFDLVNRSFMEHADAWQGELVKNVSVSVGTARLSEFPKATLKELIHAADNRMYQQKVEVHRHAFGQNPVLSPGDLISSDVSREDAAMLNTYLKAFEAEYDRTTGLPGMVYFLQSVPVLRKEIMEQRGQAAVICLRLADLNIYNITYGVQAGNELIAEFASLLARTFGKNHCARSGGNEMFVCTSDVALEERLQDLFDMTKSLHGGHATAVRAGICLAPESGREPIEKICERARIACDVDMNSEESHYTYFGAAH